MLKVYYHDFIDEDGDPSWDIAVRYNNEELMYVMEGTADGISRGIVRIIKQKYGVDYDVEDVKKKLMELGPPSE